MYKSLLFRFLRGGIAGAVGAMVVIPFAGVLTWGELLTTLSGVAIIGVIGFISGVLQALDKFYRS